MATKKTLCIQDMSCIGRCSLTVISPVLSVKGIQCVPMPTTVLSTHYGGFGQVASCELTDFCFDSLARFKEIGVHFDCVLSGFIANSRQVQLVKQAFGCAQDAVRICDPVMADNGKLYSSVTEDIVAGIKEICHHSEIITPNTTEAAILLERDFSQQSFTQQDVEEMASQLVQKYDCSVVITGAKLTDGRVVCCVAQKEGRQADIVTCNYIPVHFPGTGDLFVATMTAHLLSGSTLTDAVEKACRFVEICVKNTWAEGVDTRHGVDVELNLKYLLD